jgi:16S rRNA (uracil1498-N3)-methyltransferase
MDKPSPEALRRFYVAPERIDGDLAVLGPEETHHLARVLRLRVGARVALSDGCRGWEAVVQSLEAGGAVLKMVRDLTPWGESPLNLILGIGLAKGDALDAVIRQATEMGVKQIHPFVSERSERLTPERAHRRRGRWQVLAQESLKSCQRSFLPEIGPVQEFAAVLAGPEEVKLLFWEEERGGGLKSCLGAQRPQAARVLIGPEGGFSPGEVALAREAGFSVVSLGPRRLKVETAALTALALLQFAWGDLS